MFIHLNKKILIPNCSHLRCIAWSSEHEFIACGGDNGMLKVIKLDNTTTTKNNQNHSKNLSINQTLDSHKTTVESVCWNEKFQKLTSKDASGTIIVWMFYKGMWYEEMVNNRQKSQVTGMAWTHDGNKICIVYEDGAIITGSVDGSRLWGKEMKSINLNQVEWSPDGKIILIGTQDLEIHVFDCSGNFVKKIPSLKTSQNRSTQKLSNEFIGIKWFKNGIIQTTRPLIVAYDSGQILLMKNESDDSPLIINCEMKITSIEWNQIGDMFAVTGLMQSIGSSNSRNYLNIYNYHGEFLSMIKVPGNEIYDCSWDRNGLKLALAVDSYMYFVSLKPGIPWCFLKNSIVFLCNDYKEKNKTLVFWELKTNKPYKRILNNFLQMTSWNCYCVVVTKVDNDNGFSTSGDNVGVDTVDVGNKKNAKKVVYCLNLYNSSGTLIDYHLIEMEVKYCCMNSTRVIVTSNDSYYIWSFKPLFNVHHLSFKNSHNENLYNELTLNIGDSSGIGEREHSGLIQQPMLITASNNDQITCITISEKFFIVGYDSGAINQYLLPNVNCISKIMMDGGSVPSRMALNKSSSKLALIDKASKFHIYDFEASNEETWSEGKWLDIKFNDVWDFKWETDNNDLLTVFEKNKLIVINLSKTIKVLEPIHFNGHICQFQQLTIKTIQLDQLIADMKDKEKVVNINDYMDLIECQYVKTIKDLIDKDSITDAINFALQTPELPSLWNIISQESLKNLDVETAYLAMIKNKDYKGLQFMKHLKKIKNDDLKKAEINAYYNQFEEAEIIYLELDRPELALGLNKTIGNYERVMELFQKYNIPHHEKEMNNAHMNLAEYYADNNDWLNAMKHFEKIDANDKLVECYINEEKYYALISMIDKINDEKTLIQIAAFLSVSGFCSESVKAYLKANQFEMAINVCVNLSEWKMATELANQYKTKNVDTLLEKYVQHLQQDQRFIEMVEVYKKANKIDEANSIIVKLIEEIKFKSKDNLTLLKKLYVLIGIMYEESRKSKDTNKNTSNTTSTLDELLLSSSQNDNFSLLNHTHQQQKTVEDPWKGAEAYHYLILTQRYLYRNKYDSAMKTALHLQNYEEYLTMEQIYSMIALTAYANKFWDICSKAFIKLESLGMEQKWDIWINDLFNVKDDKNFKETMMNIEEKRNKYEKLAVKIFLKNPPNEQNSNNESSNKIVKRNCKFCDESIPDYSISCSKCHTKFSACVASGESIIDHRKNWVCKRCGHYAIQVEISSFDNCPLCHLKIQYSSS